MVVMVVIYPLVDHPVVVAPVDFGYSEIEW